MESKTQVIVCNPLFGQRMVMSAEERQKARELVWKNRHDPAVQALFNLLERKAFALQADGIQPEATAHDQGQACGALHVYGVLRTWLEVEGRTEEG